MNKEEFKFSIDVPVRFSDMDSLGHVNNAAYISYFEEGRVFYLRKLLNLPPRDSALLGIIVLDMHCNYLSPAYHGETLRVHVKVNWLKNKSFDMAYLAIDKATGRAVAEGSSVLVAYDYASERTIEIPDNFRTAISGFEGISPRKN